MFVIEEDGQNDSFIGNPMIVALVTRALFPIQLALVANVICLAVFLMYLFTRDDGRVECEVDSRT